MAMVTLIVKCNFYLVQYMTNTFEDVFKAAVFSSVSEFIAQAGGGYMYERIGVKTSMSVSLMVSSVGGLLIVLIGLQY